MKENTTDKQKNGRPPLFKTAEELQNKIDEYFESGIEEVEILYGSAKDGVHREKVKAPTISGLCYYLGFESRQAFYHLEKNNKFSYTIKRARSRIEKEYEQQLRYGNTIGAIFALKNFGWTDKQEVEHKGNITINTVNTDLSKFPKPNNEEKE